MKRVSLLFLALATLLLTSFQTSAREAAEGVPSNSSRYTLAVKWTLSLDGPKRSKGYRLDPATPAVWEGTVFVGNISGILSAIDVASGELRWRLDTGGAIESEALVTASAVYVGNNEGTIAAVSPESGKELWRYEAHDEILTRPFAYGAQLFVFTSRDRLLVLNRETGAEEGGISLSTFPQEISFRGQGNPAALDTLLVLPLSEGGLAAYDMARRQVLWRQASRSSDPRFRDTDSTPLFVVTGDDFLYSANYRQGLYALGLGTGSTAWKTDFTTLKDIDYSGGVLYLGSDTGSLLAVSALNGALKWRYDFKDTPAAILTNPVVVGDFVAIADRHFGIALFDRESGERVGGFAVPEGVSGKLTRDSEGQIYFLSNSHRLYSASVAPIR